jgi:hypothetical protein
MHEISELRSEPVQQRVETARGRLIRASQGHASLAGKAAGGLHLACYRQRGEACQQNLIEPAHRD